MLVLREYQQQTLDELEAYLRLAAEMGGKRSFIYRTDRPYNDVPQLPGLPYVCLRVPTGGGKTLLAAHAVGLATKELLRAERSVCLWLTPSNAIREQTLSALRNRNHPYRQALEFQLDGPVAVLDLTEALYLNRATADGETCVVVATLQAFRVEETEGRKVYEPSGALMDHFRNLPREAVAEAEPDADGVLAESLANVLRIRKPIVIIDEAHNARTPLSFDTLARFSPSCIVEFTATPELENQPAKGKIASNVLHQVSASALKAEDMIKLPIRLETRADWEQVVADAVGRRASLEELAKVEERETGEYVRPILLLQAQSKSATKETLTVDVLKKHLIENHRIAEEEIAVATGSTREIEGVDLFDRNCPIRYVLTVQALKEGWDCSFAYVLCSVSEVGTARAVEQVLGRILRLPHARKKNHPDLNAAYAFAASSRFEQAANSLRDALVENGFQEIEAKEFVRSGEAPRLGLPFDTVEPVAEKPDLKRLPEPLRARVTFDEERQRLTVTGELDEGEASALQECFATPEAKKAVERIVDRSRGMKRAAHSPSEAGATFDVPQLAIRRDGRLSLIDEDSFLDVDWKLSACGADLSEAEYPSEYAAGQSGELDVNAAGRIDVSFVRHVQRQLGLLGAEPNWDVAGLANWIDRRIRHPDVTPTEARLFIRRAIEDLEASRGKTVEELARDKYRLRDAVAEKIDLHRKTQAKRSFQRTLFDDRSGAVEVGTAFVFHFEDGRYAANSFYDGNYQFQKHFFPKVGELKSDGEEHECAVYLDQHAKVRFWVRNLSRRESSAFWLQTSSDKFYPDFVAMLDDGRILVVEYKGGDRYSTDDAKEKRAVGELWADRSDGKCVFVMPTDRKLTAIDAAIG